MKFPKPKIISFRDEIVEIKNTGYFTHSLYYHPAKFIPQIVRYCLKNYCGKKKNILDPFAGSGTTGLEALMYDCNAFLIDINPLLKYFYPIKFADFSKNELSKYILKSLQIVEEIFNNKSKNKTLDRVRLSYWYDEKILNILLNLWENFHQIPEENNNTSKAIIALALFKVSKFYSYAEHSMPKLFTSRKKRDFIDNLSKDYLEEKIKKDLILELNQINKIVYQLLAYKKFETKISYWAGQDSYSFDYKVLPKLDCIITSPPYLQAQEYIRTFKLEMMWLNYSQQEISNYMKLEIPYRKTEGNIKGNYIEEVRLKIHNKKLLEMFDSYFWFTLKTLEFSTKRLKKNGHLCVLIGNPKMNGAEVEIWRVIYEYFVNNLHFEPVEAFEDIIKTRKLFSGRNNPNPSGMKSEFMIVLKK